MENTGHHQIKRGYWYKVKINHYGILSLAWQSKKLVFVFKEPLQLFNVHEYRPNRHLLVRSQQWKHKSNVLNLFKINNKDIRKTSLTSF